MSNEDFPKSEIKTETETETKPGFFRRITAFTTVLILIGLLCVFFAFFRNQYNLLAQVERNISAARREIEYQRQITETLLYERSILGSAEHFERIAREQLRLVYRNEIIFRRR